MEVQSGTLYFASAVNLGGAAAVSLGGVLPGTDYTRIQFAAVPTLSGSLNVTCRNDFRPSPGDSFVVLSYPSLAGFFTAINGLDLGGGLKLEPRCDKTSLKLVAASVPTNSLPALSIYPVANSVLIQWPIEFASWQLFTTTNLLTADWLSLPVVGTNNTTLPARAPQQYFRLMKP